MGMTIEDIRKELAVLEVKSDLSEAEVTNRERLKLLIATIDDAQGGSSGKPPKDGEKVFSGEYVTELRNEAKNYRTTLRTIEAEKAVLEARLSSIDQDDYNTLKTERAEQIRLAEQAEIERRKKEGEFDQLLAEARSNSEKSVQEVSSKYEAMLSELKDRLNGFEKENQSLYFADEFNRAIADAKLGIRDPEGLRLRLDREQHLMVDEKGKKSIVLKDNLGEVMLDDSGKPLTVSGRLKQLYNDPITSYMFDSPRSGVGSSTTQTKEMANVEDEIEYFKFGGPYYSVAEQARISYENPAKYQKLVARSMKM